MMIFLQLPNELLLIILDFLSFADRLRMSGVCRRWSKLILSDLDEVTVGSEYLQTLDPHRLVTNAVFCRKEIDRLRSLNLVLKGCKNSLKKLRLSFIDGEELEGKSDEFGRLVDEMISLLIKCTVLTCLRFDYGFRLSKDKFELILRHLGPQLVDLSCNDTSSLECAYELACKYLNPNKVRKLDVHFGQSDSRMKIFFKRFTRLTSFKIRGNPDRVDFVHKMPTHIRELAVHTESLFDGHLLKEICTSKFASKLYRLKLYGTLVKSCVDCIPLKRLTSLRHLHLSDLSGESFAYIVAQLPQLESLSIEQGNVLFYSRGVHLICRLKFLQKLVLNVELPWGPGFQPSLKMDEPISSLDVLFLRFHVYGNDYSRGEEKEFIASLPRLFPNLSHLDVRTHSFALDNLFAAIGQFAQLRRLGVIVHTNSGDNDDGDENAGVSQVEGQVRTLCRQKNISLRWTRPAAQKNYLTVDRIPAVLGGTRSQRPKTFPLHALDQLLQFESRVDSFKSWIGPVDSNLLVDANFFFTGNTCIGFFFKICVNQLNSNRLILDSTFRAF